MTKTFKVRYRKRLPKRIQYAGSTIQQNFGEDLEKGYLLWDIKNANDFDSEFHRIHNDYGFYTIYADNGELPDLDLPPKCRVRVVWPIAERDISRSLVNELTRMVHAKYSPLSVRIDFKPIKDSRGKSIDVDEIVDVREFSVQQDLLKRWLNAHTLPDDMISEILEIDSAVFEKANTLEFEDFTDSLWKINSIKIKNFMSYVGPEVIDFKRYRGIIGLFGDNRSGKSVIIDAILYALFNKTTRNVKNVDLINKVSGAKSCSVELNITIRGIEYKIVRESKKQFKKRTGEYHWTRTDLELSRVFEDGTEEDLTETQRNETEKIIRNAIGSYDDFLTTTLTIQASQHEFIFQNPAVRSENMARFLGLDIFNRKHDIAKDIMREVDAARKVTDIEEKTQLYTTLEKDIVKYRNLVNSKKKSLSELNESISTNNSVLDSLRNSLNTEITIAESREDVFDRRLVVENEIIELRTLIDERNELCKNYRSNISQLRDSLIPIGEESLDLLKKSNDFNSLMQEVQTAINVDTEYVRSLEKDINESNPCPVGVNDVTSGCVYILRANQKRDELTDRLANIEQLTEKLNIINEKLGRISTINERHHMNTSTHNEINKINENIDRCKVEISTLASKVEVKEMTLAMLDEKLEIINKNEEIVEKNKATQVEIDRISNLLKNFQSDREKINGELLKASSNLAVVESRLGEISKIIDDIKSNDRKYELYNWYTKAMHRTGIAITVLKKYIPVINYELNKILSPIVGYGVYFKIDDDSDNIDIVMRYDDTVDDTRPITMASGMEKFIANMAIRHVLLKISCLNKPTIRIIDEGFDVLDNDNIYLVQKFFEHVKSDFDNIVIITHIDALKDAADYIINVSQSSGVSKLQMN